MLGDIAMTLNIPDSLAQRLEEIAQEEGSTVADLLSNWLNRYAANSPAGSLAEMAENAREAALASAQLVETAEKSREILQSEYADYLKRRMETEHDNDSDR
jgi:chromosome segregation and condensation protein ScpB